MSLEIDKAVEIGKHLEGIVKHVNAISEDDLETLLETGSQEEALGPMIDPTAWRDGLFDVYRQTSKTLQALLDFKRAVKGIGNFI